MGKVTVRTKAEIAALTIKNDKVKKLNDFYTYHKEIIDEYHKLQDEVSEASAAFRQTRMNVIDHFFPVKKRK